MFSIIDTGGKQYLVSKGNKIEIEKLEGKAGDTLKFDKVLFAYDDKNFKVGEPYTGTTVEAKILKQGKSPKIYVLKYKSKSKYRRKQGHRQLFTEIEIVKI